MIGIIVVVKGDNSKKIDRNNPVIEPDGAVLMHIKVPHVLINIKVVHMYYFGGTGSCQWMEEKQPYAIPSENR